MRQDEQARRDQVWQQGGPSWDIEKLDYYSSKKCSRWAGEAYKAGRVKQSKHKKKLRERIDVSEVPAIQLHARWASHKHTSACEDPMKEKFSGRNSMLQPATTALCREWSNR